MRWLRHLFTWTVATPVIAYVLSALLVVSVVEAFVARNEANSALSQTRTAATRRIDQLQTRIDRLQTQLRNTAVRDARERGRLEDAIDALAAQIRQAGGEPVTVGRVEPAPEPAASPSPSRTASPRPRPTRSPSRSPHPSPSPTPCTVPDVIQHPTHCLHLEENP